MRKWLIVILSVAWLAWECIAAFDGSDATWPLTHILLDYVPNEVLMAAVGVLVAWLPVHFRRPKEGSMGKYAKAITAALTAGLGSLATALADDKVTNLEWVAIASVALAALGVVWGVPNASKVQPPADADDAAVRRSYP